MEQANTFSEALNELTRTELVALADHAKIEYPATITKKALIELTKDSAEMRAAYDHLVEDVEEGETEAVEPTLESPDVEIPVVEVAPSREPEESYGRPGHVGTAPVNVSGDLSDHGTKEYVDVVRNNEYIRTYSKKVHGGSYKEIATGMAKKDAQRSLVQPGVVTHIRVEYEEVDKKDPNIKHKHSRVFQGGAECTFKEQAKAFCQAVQGQMFFR